MRARATRSIPAVAVVTVLASLLAFGAPARADDAGTARELFTQGNTFYDLGQFDKAIDAWQRGYQLKNDPGFLYNIGQAYRTMGDAEKAIFFYKRYLINAPKAKNRTEVEQKIEALQKQIDERQAPPSGLAPGATGGVTPVEPPPSATTTPPASGPAAPSASSPAAVPAVPGPAATEPPAAPAVTPPAIAAAADSEPARPIDLGVSLGFDTWSSGLRNHADPSFAFALDGGYTFGSPAARVRFRLGAVFSYTFLKETSWTESLLSFLIDPTVVVRVADRARVSADLGLGSVTITGLQPTSTLLATPLPGQMYKVNGAGVPRGVVRFGVAGEYDLMPGFSVFAWPGIASSGKSGNFYGSLTRVEVLFGAAYRL
ncbi:MAG TPA: tetratricopeptide repeat protein [Polyangia bacterium]|nr:tetratricopeptide repeat protein [Polyangia bacterium]